MLRRVVLALQADGGLNSLEPLAHAKGILALRLCDHCADGGRIPAVRISDCRIYDFAGVGVTTGKTAAPVAPPSTSSIANATLIALGAAVLLLFTPVLPAECGIDLFQAEVHNGLDILQPFSRTVARVALMPSWLDDAARIN